MWWRCSRGAARRVATAAWKAAFPVRQVLFAWRRGEVISSTLLHAGQDDAPQNDLLTGEEDDGRGNRDEHEAGHHAPRLASHLLAHLVHPYGERPVGLVLAHEERPLPRVVRGDEAVERVDGEDGRRHGKGDAAEDRPLTRAVDRRRLVEFARQGVEEPLEDEDGHAARDGGQHERGERVEEAEVAHEQEAGNRGDGRRERHRREEEEDDLLRAAQAEAGERVGGERVDGEVGEDGKEDEQDGVAEGASAQEEVLSYEPIVRRRAAPEVAAAVRDELHGERGAHCRRVVRADEREGERAADVVAVLDHALAVGVLELEPHLVLGVAARRLPRGVAEGNLRLGGERDVEEAAVADGPGAVDLVEGGLRLDERGDVARVVGAGGVVDVVGERAVAERLCEPLPFEERGLVRAGRLHPLVGEAAYAVGITRDGDPAAPGGGRVREHLAREAREVGGDRAHEAVRVVPQRAHHGRVAVVVVRPREAGGEHHEKRVDHRQSSQRKQGVDEGQKETALAGVPFGWQQDAHGRKV